MSGTIRSDRRVQRFVELEIFLVGLLATLLQITFGLSPLVNFESDMGGYLERGLRFAEGRMNQPIDTFFPPGTSYAFGAVFAVLPFSTALCAIAIGQCIALALGNVFLSLTVSRLFRDRRLGAAAGFCGALFWPLVARASFFLSEPIFIALTLAGQYAVVRAATGARNKSSWLVLAGTCFGTALLARSQAMCFLAASCSFLLLTVSWRRLAQALMALLLPVAVIAGAQMVHNRVIGRSTEWFLSANDTYNIYVGQSRDEGVGAYDQAAHRFYVFYNDNSSTPYFFAPVQVFEGSILDRKMFLDRVKDLWRQSPRRQVVRSLMNAVELWCIRGSWPVRNEPWMARMELWWQWFAAAFIILPAGLAVAASIVSGRGRRLMLALALPLIFLTMSACVSTGQPRFLFSMYHNLFPLSLIFWRRLSNGLRGRKSAWSLSTLGLSTGAAALVAIAAIAVMREAVKTVPPRTDSSEEHYETLADLSPHPAADGILFRGDLGRSCDAMVSPRIAQSGYGVALAGFGCSSRWKWRQVSWAAETASHGSISFVFPLEKNPVINPAVDGAADPLSVALYLTDGDSFRRVSLVRSGRQYVVAQSEHNGRWIVLPVSPEERRKGEKKVDVMHLLGDSVALSGAIIFRPVPEP